MNIALIHDRLATDLGGGRRRPRAVRGSRPERSSTSRADAHRAVRHFEATARWTRRREAIRARPRWASRWSASARPGVPVRGEHRGAGASGSAWPPATRAEVDREVALMRGLGRVQVLDVGLNAAVAAALDDRRRALGATDHRRARGADRRGDRGGPTSRFRTRSPAWSSAALFRPAVHRSNPGDAGRLMLWNLELHRAGSP